MNARARQRQSGMTLVEMMISLVILTIAVSAVLGLGATLIDGYRESRRMVLVETSARASIDIVADAVRNASPGIESGNIGDAVGCSTFGTLRVTNATNAPDELEVIHASGGVLTSLRAAYNQSSTQMTVVDASELAIGDYLIVTNFTTGFLVQVTDAPVQNANDWTVETDPSPASNCGAATFAYSPGDLVIRARLSRFYIEMMDTTPTLMMDPDGEDGPELAEPLAAGIEDFQIAVGVDADADGTVFEDGSSADEWHYNAANDFDPPAVTVTPWRAVRISVVARSAAEASVYTTNLRPAVEDRPIATAADVYRRRVLSATVEVRNLLGSP